jgi:hypothetical protein
VANSIAIAITGVVAIAVLIADRRSATRPAEAVDESALAIRTARDIAVRFGLDGNAVLGDETAKPCHDCGAILRLARQRLVCFSQAVPREVQKPF